MKKLIFILIVGSLFADEIDSSLKLVQEGKFEEAIDIIMPLAIKGDSEAQYWLSKFYGEDGLKNKEETVKWLFIAADNGNSDAQYLASKIFREDNLNDPVESEKWLYKAANNGNSDAQYDIGWSFSRGWLDSPIDSLVNAIYWFEKSGYNGNTSAYANLSAIYDKNHRNVLHEMEEAANNGNALAQYNMGWINARGLLSDEGLMQDIDIAKVWFEKSAALGFEDAKRILKENFSEPVLEENE